MFRFLDASHRQLVNVCLCESIMNKSAASHTQGSRHIQLDIYFNRRIRFRGHVINAEAMLI